VKLGLPAGPVLPLDQVFSDPHVLGAGMVEEIEHPRLGRMRAMANPLRMAALAGKSVRRAPPGLGEDSRAVLADYGVPAAEIDALLGSGVVKQA
jgi:crotonobetainyl-CoA:carnitine CoA-transferase CaiB-like acyl-CoA transferase